MDRPANDHTQENFPVGTQVEVRDRFCAGWSRGFQVSDAARDGYRVSRMSDRYVLPVRFVTRDVRRAG
jgi:hypothetical protein